MVGEEKASPPAVSQIEISPTSYCQKMTVTHWCCRLDVRHQSIGIKLKTRKSQIGRKAPSQEEVIDWQSRVDLKASSLIRRHISGR